MAVLKTVDNKIDVPDGEAIKEYAEDLGVPFGCKQGLCGTCKIRVIEGMENLSNLNQEEIDMNLEDDERLACQCKIKKGTVIIDF